MRLATLSTWRMVASTYTRGVHPIDQRPHEWLRSTTAWLLCAAHITFADGTRHLTPGYPTMYNGQWMRDGYYGMAQAWELVNATHQAQYIESFEWMLSRARADGILPQMCPPTSRCDYGNNVHQICICVDYFVTLHTTAGRGWEHSSAGYQKAPKQN